MNLDNYNLDVDFDQELGLLKATLTVPQIPKAHGTRGYTLEDILVMLEERGFELSSSDCVSRTVGTVRTHTPTAGKGTWTFKLPATTVVEPKVEPKTQPKVKPKVKPKTQPKVEPKAKPRVEPKAKPRVEPKVEKAQTKKAKKTTNDVLKEYAKKAKR